MVYEPDHCKPAQVEGEIYKAHVEEPLLKLTLHICTGITGAFSRKIIKIPIGPVQELSVVDAQYGARNSIG